ncbi:MAG: 7TM domain-containing protein, partial [Thermoanaerobaculia bacterium]
PRPPAPRRLADLEESRFAAAYAVLTDAVERSADLETLISQVVQRLQDGSDPNVALLVGPRASAADRLEAAVLVLGLREVSARVVQGVRLEQRRRDASLVDGLEVWDGDEWVPFDPETGRRGADEDVLPLVLGPGPVAEIDGAEDLSVHFAVRQSEQTSLRAATVRGTLVAPDLLRFSLHGLPIQTQEVYRVLLMVPVGAFLLVLLRGLVGIKTFGTFMPVLIALAFRETRLGVGIVLFLLIVGLGLAARFYLERLQLLLVPRLAAVLTIVVLLMLALSILSQRLSIERGLSVALFPMVILTMTIERMSLVWEERGAGEALQQAAGTLLAAVLAYLAMSNRWVAHWSFVYPELLLAVLAGCLVMGCYSGYRLLELWRFRELARRGPRDDP